MGVEFVDILHGILAVGLLIGPLVAMTIAGNPELRNAWIYDRL